MNMNAGKGPLAGVKIVEMQGIGPAPLAAMLLADLGADVMRVERMAESGIGVARPREFDFATRGRAAVSVDLKREEGVAFTLGLITQADGLVEGFRPGVMERLGLGPEPCLRLNPRLAYGRLTGWGQSGPLASTAGHDLNYLALTGVLDRLGRAGSSPTPPINLLGDYAGGSMLMAFGLLAAILSARTTGRGQVVDAAMVDGVSLLAVPLLGLIGAGIHDRGRGENLLDTGAPHYDVYPCADGAYLSVAAIEPKFRAQLLTGLGFDPNGFPDVARRENWAEARRLIAERIASRPRAQWIDIFEGTDACVAPVLTFEEAIAHPHNEARASYVEIGGKVQPAPGPRFSETPAGCPSGPKRDRSELDGTLTRWGIEPDRIAQLRRSGALL
ncbi:CaiB/BaiF CoA transferase family protein [Mesorhizobium sp. 1B3]|uniref:CaiB/BaiF CoA transferase family protein n=1 Tax=Mesorhizobium sp. 1B3 TaxID=3243599 RepID=UPI003D9728DD